MAHDTDDGSGGIRLVSARDLTTEKIRMMIHSGELAQGAKVSIDELAERFGVSRTPVRDALRELNGEGLITILPRVGVRVRTISTREVLEVYAIKGSLEPLMARWATECGTPEARRRFHDEASDLMSAAEAGDVDRYVELLEDRRGQLLEMTGSDVLRDSFAVIDGRVRLLRYRNLSQAGRLRESAEQHVAIARAVRDGDAQEAEHLMRHHMLDAEMRLRRLIEAHPEEFGDPTPDEPEKPSRRRGFVRRAR